MNLRTIQIFIINLLFLSLGTVGCQQASQFSSDSASEVGSYNDPSLGIPVGLGGRDANGNPYEGKLTYIHIDKSACESRGFQSQPVFAEIQRNLNGYFLTRNNCTSITPQFLASSQLTLADSGSHLLVYNNKAFQLQTQATLPNVQLTRGLICESNNPASDANQVVILGTSNNTASVSITSSAPTPYQNQLSFTFTGALGTYPISPIPALTQVPNGQDLDMTLTINSAQSIDYVFADNLTGIAFLGPGVCVGSF